MKTLSSLLVVLAISTAAVSNATARDSFSIGINVGGYGQGYYAPPVRYYSAPPVVYYPHAYYGAPRVIYSNPHYYAPRASFGYRNYQGNRHGWNNGGHRGHRGHGHR